MSAANALARILMLAGACAVGSPAAGGGNIAGGNGPPPEVATRAARLWTGFAEVLRFERTVGTIIVGDAAIVNAAVVDEGTVVLTALAPGRTNVVVLGQDGEALSRLSVIVRAPNPPVARVYSGTALNVLVCDPDCLPGAAPAAPEE